jgi:HD-GYP domain-containing protein (c-di-GMP phosphodiesterase class II)
MGTAKNSGLSPAVAELMERYDSAAPEPLSSRERVVDACLGAPLIAVAVAIAVGFHAERPFELGPAVLLVLAFLAAKRIRFVIGAAYTVPTQLVFVPMVFLLPTPLVPVIVMAGSLIGAVPRIVSGKTHADRLLVAPADSAFAIAPVLVLLLGHAQAADWSHLPLYAAALVAQLAFDPLLATAREWVALGVSPRLQPELSDLVLLVDAMLAPIGFLGALAGSQTSGGWLLVLPLLGLIAVFARERQARIEHALELGRAYRGTALLLGDMVETDDAYTGSHSRDVVELALEVGRRMSLGPEALRDLEFGALLHDVGKIAVPKEIINKPGKLSAEEWEVMKRHTIEGQRMLENVGGVLGRVGVIVRASHEDYDGTGYPDGLAGEAIPIEARICSACDAFSAMTTDRSYRAAMPLEDAIAELRRCSGTQFDPDVVDALVTILDSESVARVETARPGLAAASAG